MTSSTIKTSSSSTLADFIETIHRLISNGSKYISSIRNPFDLLASLRKLDDVVGLGEIKKSVISQIKFVIVNDTLRKYRSVSSDKNLFDGHFLNLVLSGPPGCGKTSVAKILCSIYSSLGIITAPSIDSSKKKISRVNSIPKLTSLSSSEDVSLSSNDFESLFPKNGITLDWNEVVECIAKIKRVISDTKSYSHKRILGEGLDSLMKIFAGFSEEKEFFTKKQLYEVVTKTMTLINRNLEKALKRSSSADELSSSVEIKENSSFKIFKREDLVAEYVGQTAPKTQKALESALGGVVLIDEAYELYNTSVSEDPFGMEALSTLNQFLSLHPNEIMIIFSGYTELLKKTIFKAQPGLRRRIAHTFNFEKYTGEELFSIFEKQLYDNDMWKVEDREEIKKLFVTKEDYFVNYGGDTLRLVKSVTESITEKYFDVIVNTNIIPEMIISIGVVKECIEKLKDGISSEEMDHPPFGMYS